MNLIQALKSGKRFRRQFRLKWFTDELSFNFSKIDLLAEDWEVEEEKVTITRTQLIESLKESINCYISENAKKQLAVLLGFKC